MTAAHDPPGVSASGAPVSRAANPGSGSLERALERARDERDDALRHAVEVEQQLDLSHELALRFEREFEDQRRALAQARHDEL
ncbi:MAG TPA: hypothetical protein VN324_04005, partial [Quisquiliibacterium sp.]|nr:hypothetical protein [Quisquiliibacterium sp.]